MKLSNHLAENIEKSCLAITNQLLFEHHWSGSTVENRNDPSWQNQALFFWSAGEKFEKKSLPPDFATFEVKRFLVKKVLENISLQRATAIPWFGMPGGGTKFAFTRDKEEQSIIDLVKGGMLAYVEIVELTDDNDYILQDRDNYLFHMNQDVVQFKQNSFVLNGEPVSITEAYLSGGLIVLKTL